jgi:hypothetical protein
MQVLWHRRYQQMSPLSATRSSSVKIHRSPAATLQVLIQTLHMALDHNPPTECSIEGFTPIAGQMPFSPLLSRTDWSFLNYFAGNTINVNPDTGAVQIDCKGLTLGRFYYVRYRRNCRSCFITCNSAHQVRISSSNVLGFGPARVTFPPPPPMSCLPRALFPHFVLIMTADVFFQFHGHQWFLHICSRQVLVNLPCFCGVSSLLCTVAIGG